MRDVDPAPSPLHHKEEGKGRIMSDGKDRLSLRKKLELCIDPLDPEQHPRDGRVNIGTGEGVYHPSVNADQAVALGKQQCEEFEAGWPDSFYNTISRVVNPMSVSGKFIEVGHSKVFDTAVLCDKL